MADTETPAAPDAAAAPPESAIRPAPSEAAEPPDRARAVCRCGHDRDHFMVSGEGKYTTMGYIYLLFGVTAYPTEVSFRCRRCQQVFDRTDDEELCKKYR